jgi:ADP-heptose:LPS heptosyltransferase
MTAVAQAPFGHVLVARLDSAGDVLLAGPAVRAAAAGAAEVTLLHGPIGRQAAALLPGVTRTVEFHCPWIDAHPAPLDPAAVDALVATARELRPDAALILTSFHQSALPLALLLRMAGVPTIAAISEDFPGTLLDVRHRDLPDGLHETERALSTAATLGLVLPDGDDGRLRVDLRGATAPAVPDRYVVVHPGASVPARAWSPGRHAALVALLAAAGHDVVVTGAPDETALTARVAGAHALDLGGRTTLAQTGAVLAGAQVAVVANTGPAHLAAAVGTPVVSLFAPTVPPERWRPFGVPAAVLHRQVPCAGCRARACPVPGHPCLEGVTPQEVLHAVQDLAHGPARPVEEVRA